MISKNNLSSKLFIFFVLFVFAATFVSAQEKPGTKNTTVKHKYEKCSSDKAEKCESMKESCDRMGANEMKSGKMKECNKENCGNCESKVSKVKATMEELKSAAADKQKHKCTDECKAKCEAKT